MPAGPKKLICVLGEASGVPGWVNQDAFILPGSDGVPRAHAIQVVTVTGTGIARIVAFMDARLFVTFGLPQELAAAATGLS